VQQARLWRDSKGRRAGADARGGRGRAAIPFIVHPIDNAVHVLLNMTMRPAMRKFICGAGQGGLADLEICAACGLDEGPAQL